MGGEEERMAKATAAATAEVEDKDDEEQEQIIIFNGDTEWAVAHDPSGSECEWTSKKYFSQVHQSHQSIEPRMASRAFSGSPIYLNSLDHSSDILSYAVYTTQLDK